MKSILSIFLFLLFLATGIAAAAEIREIELKDGTVMVGEVVSLSNGVYTVKTDTLGTITIDETKVRAIRQKGEAAGFAPDVNAQSRSLQERMLKDREVMSKIESLRSDPDFQKVLNDPAIMKAVNDGDISALTANPEFMKLLQHSTVQDIKKKVGE
ncbi:MAG TPA: hypothetical protein VN604_00925 [Nitrospirota bacterium]|nr:hypothetical protein [Nitrospirota bacterium]